MGSTRLPGKSMMKLAGEPLVGRILERLKRVKMVSSIVLATSKNYNDGILVDLAKDYNVNYYRGSENDLVDRYYMAAKQFGADIIVRFPGDNPTPEPVEIDRIIEYHIKSDNHFSTNLVPAFNNGYPMGIGAEVFDKKTLKSIWSRNKDLKLREHLSLNFYNYYQDMAVDPINYKVGTIKCPEKFSGSNLILHVDTQEDFDYMKRLYNQLYPKNNKFTINDIISWDSGS